MNVIRTILSVFYLLLMVLLPWVHMPSHGSHAEEQIQAAHACGHHHHDHEDQEAPESDDCGLCSLAVVQTDLPQLFLLPEALFTLIDLPVIPAADYNFTALQSHQARAPPFQTV